MGDDAGVHPVAETWPAGPAVRGALHRPAGRARGALVLTHGAGSNHDAPLLVAVARALAGLGIAVLRCDLPYRQARPAGPPFPAGAPRDREGLRRALEVVRRLVPGPVFLGGHSYGGRQASILVAQEGEIASGLLLLSYPLHPPHRPAEPRTAHFPEIRVPTLFVHGSQDPFGSVDELRDAAARMPARTDVLVIAGGGHALAAGDRRADPSPIAAQVALAFTRAMALRAEAPGPARR
jgi:predicted alpha/beta-hydrolase family hydrolase